MQYFHEIEFAIHDLADGVPGHVDEYLNVYKELLPEYSRYIPVMRQRAGRLDDPSSHEKWHQWLLQVQDRPFGMIEFLYNRRRNTGLLLDFGIKPEARNIGYREHPRLAGFVLSLAIEQLIRDARANGQDAPLCMVTEVEYAPLVEKYAEYGFVEFPIEYYEPPCTPELGFSCAGRLHQAWSRKSPDFQKTPGGLAVCSDSLCLYLESSADAEIFDKIGYKKMYLGAFQIPGHPFDPNDLTMIKTALLSLLEDHYGVSADHWLMQRMFQGIRE